MEYKVECIEIPEVLTFETREEAVKFILENQEGVLRWWKDEGRN